MKRALLTLALSLSAVPAVALACDGAEQRAEASPKKVTITEVASWLKEKKVTPVDANGADFRAKNGVLPGAVLLTSSASFDANKELPAKKDSKLVFYCANTACSASHFAAMKAIEAGYSDVTVLPDGLQGWKKAGQKVDSLKPNS
jgi:rhodanese-related sulfurtransferase